MLGRDKKRTITTKTKSRKTARTLLKNTSTGTLTMRSDVVDTIEMTPIIKTWYWFIRIFLDHSIKTM